MTTDKHGRCVHYLVFRRNVSWSTTNGKLNRTIKWEFLRELDSLSGHYGAFIRRQDLSIFQVRRIRHYI